MEVRSDLLITQIMPEFVCEALSKNAGINSIFGDSLFAYKRLDINVNTLPALCVYITNTNAEDYFNDYNGNLAIDIYLPITHTREDGQIQIDKLANYVTALIKYSVQFQSDVAKHFTFHDENMNQDVCYLLNLGREHNTSYIDAIELDDGNESMYILCNYSLQFNAQMWLDWLNSKGYTIDDILYPDLVNLEQFDLEIKEN